MNIGPSSPQKLTELQQEKKQGRRKRIRVEAIFISILSSGRWTRGSALSAVLVLAAATAAEAKTTRP